MALRGRSISQDYRSALVTDTITCAGAVIVLVGMSGECWKNGQGAPLMKHNVPALCKLDVPGTLVQGLIV